MDERKSQLKKKIQNLLEAQMKLCPVTPRTPRTTGTGSKYQNMPRYRKVDNFLANLFGDSMENENFVSIQNKSIFRSNKYHLPHLWYQFNEKN